MCNHFNIFDFVLLQRVLRDQDDAALLKAYISEWSKFFTQCNYLPLPFGPLETALTTKTAGGNQQKKTAQTEDTIVRKVG